MQGPGATQSPSNSLMPSLVIAGGAALWGLYWIPLRATEELGVPPIWSVLLFNIPLVIVSGLILAARFAENSRAMGQIMLAGLLAGAGLALYGMGLVLTTVVKATLLFYLTPVWGTLIGMAVLGERPGARRWVALGFGVAGLCLTVGLTPADMNLVFGLGEAVGLASGLCWAAGATVIRRAEGLPISGLAFFQFLTAAVITLIFALALGEGWISVETAIGGINWYLIIGAAIMLITMFAIFRVMAFLSPGRSGLLMMTEVIVAVFSAAIFLPEEALSFWEWVGAGLIITAGVIEVTGGET